VVTNHKFQRKNFSPWVKKYLAKEKIELPPGDLIEFISFNTIIQYPDEVKNYAGKNLELSENRKMLIQTNKLNDVLENKTNVGIKSRQK
jgi:hypothetical protein